MNTVVATPSFLPGGLEATLAEHFGHCEVFTIVNVDDGRIGEVRVVPNLPHEQGGCASLVQLLAQNGAQALIAGGMGMRPLQAFGEAGIDVYHNGGLASVTEAVAALAAGQLQRFGPSHTCAGGDGTFHGFMRRFE